MQQQSLDRRQPSARFRPQLREIPLQRRHEAAGNGENNRQWTSRDDRSGPVLRGGGVLVGVGNAPDTTTGQDIQATIAATIGPEALEEHGPDLVEPVLTGVDVPGDVGLSAAPAAEPLDGVGEPEEAREVRSLVGLAPLSVGTASGGAERVGQTTVDVAGDHLHDAQLANDCIAEGDRPAADVPAAGDPLSGDLPVVPDQAWEWMEPLLPSSTGRRGGRWRDHRQVVEAICWKYRTGSPWRDLPARFGPWQTAYERLTRWSADGTWARLLARAQTDADAAGELDWLVAVNSTVVRVQQHGTSARWVGGRAAAASSAGPQNGAAA
jgi:putative transposase